jgi:uncharacterized membrane protein YhhN
VNALRLASIACSAVYLATTPWHPYPGSAPIKGASILLLAWLCFRAHGIGIVNRALLGFALVLSSIGDVVLDLSPEKLFVAGLGSFLLAHLAYVALFTRNWPRPLSPNAGQLAIVLVVILYTGAFATWLVPGLAALAIPVMLYVCAITAMVVSAVLARFESSWIAAGAGLFLISDCILAVNKFKTEVPLRDYLVWATYYAAQYAIATGFLLRKRA